jgi:hypothetical protein
MIAATSSSGVVSAARQVILRRSRHLQILDLAVQEPREGNARAWR